jgi:hypothetical protein
MDYAQSIRKITQKRIGRKQLKDNVKIELLISNIPENRLDFS